MMFWDSSAIAPLVMEEPSSDACRALLPRNTPLFVWALTSVEVTSAIRRKQREGALTLADARLALDRLDALATGWIEVDMLESVRRRATRLLATHSLRAEDALQLGAALIAAGETRPACAFVTRDARLAAAADAEGLRVFEPR
jgi:predicted nucleic acid-binding protein